MTKAYLIMDIGTGNARVSLISTTGIVLQVKTKDTSFLRDPLYEDGWSFDPERLWMDICSLSQEVIASVPTPVEIAAVTSTSARETIILMDASGHAFLALPNVDNRGIPWQNQIQKKDWIYARTGRWVSPVFSALKLVGLRERRPGEYRKIAKITSISDWLGYKMTGVCVYEPAQACETQLMDIQKNAWSEDLCTAFGVDSSILPDLAASGTCLGQVRTDACQQLGLPAPVPYFVGGADTQVAARGAGAQTGDCAIVSGTTSPVVRILDHHFHDPAQRCWIDCYLEPGHYMLESNAGVTGLNYQRFKNMFFPDVPYEVLDAQMEQKQSFRCMASFGTLIFAENRSLYQGGFTTNAPIAPDLDRFDFALSIVQDIAFSIVSNYFNQNDILPLEIRQLIGCGGGLQSRVLCKTIANLAGKPLNLPTGFIQASLRGCADVCNQSLGEGGLTFEPAYVFEPDPDTQLLRQQYEKWMDYRNLLNPISKSAL